MGAQERREEQSRLGGLRPVLHYRANATHIRHEHAVPQQAESIHGMICFYTRQNVRHELGYLKVVFRPTNGKVGVPFAVHHP